MAVKQREYLLTTNKFKEPEVKDGQEAVGLLLLRLIIMEPGTNPLHPDMGIGISDYRYTMDKTEELRKRIEDQITKYLPYFSDCNVALIYCPDKTVNVEISVGEVTYVYESSSSPKPILLEDISSN